MNTKVIGIGGYARCGKDTFVGIAKNILTKNGYIPIKIAFADSLKEEVEKMLKQNNFSATVYVEDTEAKTCIRPLLVWWGCQRRRESEGEGGLYWINIADEKIHNNISYIYNGKDTDIDKLVFLISDVRFKNEAKWIQEKWKGEFIHLRRWCIQEVRTQEGKDRGFAKVFDPAPNEEELKQDPLIQEIADQHVEWENKKMMTSAEAVEDAYLKSVVLETLNATKFFKHPTAGILSL